jgi:imidazolonepropionase
MADLNIIPDGAVLVRDGVIEEVGTTRRVENLVSSRLAREIDATGKVVMPAFVDPDIAIAAPLSGLRTADDPGEKDIRRMSRRRLESHATDTVADLARYGVLTVGAHTLSAPDLQNTHKTLKLHQAMQSKPLRIRSIFAPPCGNSELSDLTATDTTGLRPDEDRYHRERLSKIWMPAIFRSKLASLLEISVAPGRVDDARALASAAAAIGYNIRLRIPGSATADTLELAYSAGAVALVGPNPGNSDMARALADVGCVNVALTTRILAGDCADMRSAVDDGSPVALASGYRRDGPASYNPQFLLFLACQRLGLTPEEAIVATTYNAACSLRLSHVTGSLAPGKSADICIMDVDEYHELARRAGHHDAYLVMRAGKIVYRRPTPTTDWRDPVG